MISFLLRRLYKKISKCGYIMSVAKYSSEGDINYLRDNERNNERDNPQNVFTPNAQNFPFLSAQKRESMHYHGQFHCLAVDYSWSLRMRDRIDERSLRYPGVRAWSGRGLHLSLEWDNSFTTHGHVFNQIIILGSQKTWRDLLSKLENLLIRPWTGRNERVMDSFGE